MEGENRKHCIDLSRNLVLQAGRTFISLSAVRLLKITHSEHLSYHDVKCPIAVSTKLTIKVTSTLPPMLPPASALKAVSSDEHS